MLTLWAQSDVALANGLCTTLLLASKLILGFQPDLSDVKEIALCLGNAGSLPTLPSAVLVLLQAGYYCSVCDCILRDSQSYLDHINGKWHNRALGMSMRVERSNADQVSRSRSSCQIRIVTYLWKPVASSYRRGLCWM